MYVCDDNNLDYNPKCKLILFYSFKSRTFA